MGYARETWVGEVEEGRPEQKSSRELQQAANKWAQESLLLLRQKVSRITKGGRRHSKIYGTGCNFLPAATVPATTGLISVLYMWTSVGCDVLRTTWRCW